MKSDDKSSNLNDGNRFQEMNRRQFGDTKSFNFSGFGRCDCAAED